MKVIAKFGMLAGRSGFGKDGKDPYKLASVIRELTDDLLDHGVHSASGVFEAEHGGRIDWKGTFREGSPRILEDGSYWFKKLKRNSVRDGHENHLSLIHAGIMAEILRDHDWWLPSGAWQALDDANIPETAIPREEWSTVLDRLSDSVFRDRDHERLCLMKAYVDCTSSGHGKSSVCGISDFSTVWEKMLRDVLRHSSSEWKSLLPQPRWTKRDGTSDFAPGLKPDVVLSRGNMHVVADAKYYDAVSEKTLPSLSDLTKQEAYRKTLEQALGGNHSVASCFVFPSKEGTGPYATVEMSDRNGNPFSEPTGCVYLSTSDVMTAWLEGKTIDIFPEVEFFRKR